MERLDGEERTLRRRETRGKIGSFDDSNKEEGVYERTEKEKKDW